MTSSTRILFVLIVGVALVGCSTGQSGSDAATAAELRALRQENAALRARLAGVGDADRSSPAGATANPKARPNGSKGDDSSSPASLDGSKAATDIRADGDAKANATDRVVTTTQFVEVKAVTLNESRAEGGGTLVSHAALWVPVTGTLARHDVTFSYLSPARNTGEGGEGESSPELNLGPVLMQLDAAFSGGRYRSLNTFRFETADGSLASPVTDYKAVRRFAGTAKQRRRTDDETVIVTIPNDVLAQLVEVRAMVGVLGASRLQFNADHLAALRAIWKHRQATR